MTFQRTDKLINHFQKIDLDQFHLINIYNGDPNNQSELTHYPLKSNPIQFDGDEGDLINTSNYKGYTATYVLNENGNLILEYYGFGKYDITQVQIDELREDLKNDFTAKYPEGVSDEYIIELILDELQEYNYIENTPELIQGDFWMCVRESINSPKIYIPFRNDIIVGNKEEWIEDKLKNPPRVPNALFTLQTSFQAIKKMVLFRKKL